MITTRDELTLDIECYKDYFLAKWRHRSKGIFFELEAHPGKPFDKRRAGRCMAEFRQVTFNGIRYDVPMMAYAITGEPDEDGAEFCARMKRLSDYIIESDKRPWEVTDDFGFEIPRSWDHVDIIEVAPGKASLKLYAGRMHAQKLQDLPVEPSASIGPADRVTLSTYCGNDHINTDGLRKKLDEACALRDRLSEQYGIDLRSKSDAQIAEAVVKAEVLKITGEKVARPSYPAGFTFRYEPPKWLAYRTDKLREVLRKVRETDFYLSEKGKVMLPDWIKETPVEINGSVYRMGIGGLHSSESAQTLYSDDEYVLLDRDVASYYPFIILNNRYFPLHIGEPFLAVYRSIVEQRIAAKKRAASIAKQHKAGDAYKKMPEWLEAKAEESGLKITINGLFGKLGSKWSAVFSPHLLIQVTMTGQLALLMLIEMLEAHGHHVVSANTDGIVTRARREDLGTFHAVVKAWEKLTGFDTEETQYDALHSRDVNNYFAIKPDGDVKGKGAFADPGLMKNPNATIIPKAVKAYLLDGTPLEQTIRASTDIREFTFLRTVRGGGVWRGDYLGKVVRWYRSSGSTDAITYKLSGNKVPLSDNSQPCMDLPFDFPVDIDYAWYVNEAVEVLMDIGERPRPPKLTKKRKKELEALAALAEEKDKDD